MNIIEDLCPVVSFRQPYYRVPHSLLDQYYTIATVTLNNSEDARRVTSRLDKFEFKGKQLSVTQGKREPEPDQEEFDDAQNVSPPSENDQIDVSTDESDD